VGVSITQAELAEAVRAIDSSIRKCEKARAKLGEGSPQRKWVDRQLAAFYIALALIDGEHVCAEQELNSASETYALLIGKCEPLLDKFAEGSAQRTLARRRLEAFRIAASLIAKELETGYGEGS
jgi:hypothetical protein